MVRIIDNKKPNIITPLTPIKNNKEILCKKSPKIKLYLNPI